MLQIVIGANPWVIHRQAEIFGNDCEVFRPERWLEGDRSQMGACTCHLHNTKLTETDRNFFAFGSGARTCIGRSEFRGSCWAVSPEGHS
jgi:cytochrome P450